MPSIKIGFVGAPPAPRIVTQDTVRLGENGFHRYEDDMWSIELETDPKDTAADAAENKQTHPEQKPSTVDAGRPYRPETRRHRASDCICLREAII